MFFNAAPHPTPVKHVIYLIASTLLGIFLSLIVHAISESLYLDWVTNSGRPITWYGGCALHPAIQIGLLVLGAIGGYLIGRLWWRLVYIDRIWAKKIGGQPDNNPPAQSNGR
ncbi:MAG: hypothetical protein WCT27_01995 [Patescibacteria group bacterium]|jgi:hypothetical protein